jgi:hypothetical protein
MDKRKTEIALLKEMIRCGQGESGHRLMERIVGVERQERRSRRWTFVIGLGLLTLVGVVGVGTQGWAWVLRQSEHPVAQVVLWVGGTALFGLVVVVGCWLWHRRVLGRLAREAQRYTMGWLALCGRSELVDHSPGSGAGLEEVWRRRGEGRAERGTCRSGGEGAWKWKRGRRR